MKKETTKSTSVKETKASAKETKAPAKPKRTSKKEVSADVYAAIAMAIYQSTYEAHDEESGMLTIKRPDRRFSPWAMKTLTLRELPKR